MSAGLTNRLVPAALASAALGLVLAVAAAAPADAGDRKARPHGDYTRHTEVRRTGNGHSRTDTWSGERGTATRQADVSRDQPNQTRTREVQWTGPRGGTSTRDVTAVRDPASGTWTKDVAVDRTPPPAPEGG